MSAWEYKVVPAPTKGLKARGIKGPEHRFAYALETLMNDMAADGWEFQRAETLPSIERTGLTGSTTEWRNVLVFRRSGDDETEEFEHELLPAPEVIPDADTNTAPKTERTAVEKPETGPEKGNSDDPDEFQLERADVMSGDPEKPATVEAVEPPKADDSARPHQAGQPNDGSDADQDTVPDAVNKEFVQKIIEKSKD